MFLIPLAIWLFMLIGWVMNVIALLHAPLLSPSGETIVRVLGVFVAPIGSLMGWFY